MFFQFGDFLRNIDGRYVGICKICPFLNPRYEINAGNPVIRLAISNICKKPCNRRIAIVFRVFFFGGGGNSMEFCSRLYLLWSPGTVRRALDVTPATAWSANTWGKSPHGIFYPTTRRKVMNSWLFFISKLARKKIANFQIIFGFWSAELDCVKAAANK